MVLAMVTEAADVLGVVARATVEIDFNLPGSPDPFGPFDGPGIFPPLFPGPGDGPPDDPPPDEEPPEDEDPPEDCEQ